MKAFRNFSYGKLASFMFMVNALGLIQASSALASINSSIPWADMSPLDPVAIARTQFTSPKNRFDSLIPDSVIEHVIRDDEHKISPEFQIYPEFKAPTKFWLKIYSQYSSKDIVIYDSKNMDVIYEVVDLRPLQYKSRNAVVFEILSQQKVKKTIAAYKKAFLALSKNDSPTHPSREESIILNAMKDSKAPAHWKEMASSIKSMKGQRDPIIQGMLNGEEYFPKMEKLFIQAGVPVELTRLCLVESSFNIKAGSKVGASGIWQIMPKVGKQYLKMDQEKGIDERLSPLKSSIAAAKLLKFNYKYLGSWILAVVSYNHGFKGLPRLKPHTYNFSKIAHLFHPSGNKKEVLGWASKNYYAEYLAILHASMYSKDIYGDLPEIPYHRNFEFKQLTTAETGLDFIKENNISSTEFLAYNTDIQSLKKPLMKGLWVAFPGDNQNFQDVVDYSLTSHKRSQTHLAKGPHHHHHHASKHHVVAHNHAAKSEVSNKSHNT